MADYDAGPGAAGGVGLGDYALECEVGGLERNGALSHDAHPRVALRVGCIVGGGGGFGKVGAGLIFWRVGGRMGDLQDLLICRIIRAWG